MNDYFEPIKQRFKEQLEQLRYESALQLIDVSLPYLIAPNPASSIVQFQPHPKSISTNIPINTELLLQTSTQSEQFMTMRPVTTNTATVESVTISHHPKYDRISLFIENNQNSELNLYLAMDNDKALQLIDRLAGQLIHLSMVITDTVIFSIPLSQLQFFSSKNDETISPLHPNTPKALQHLIERLSHPQHCQFITLLLPETSPAFTLHFDCIPSSEYSSIILQPEYFQFNCTPIVNLFKVATKPKTVINKVPINLMPDSPSSSSDLFTHKILSSAISFNNGDKAMLYPYYAAPLLHDSKQPFHQYKTTRVADGKHYAIRLNTAIESKQPIVHAQVLCAKIILDDSFYRQSPQMTLHFWRQSHDNINNLILLTPVQPPTPPILCPEDYDLAQAYLSVNPFDIGALLTLYAQNNNYIGKKLYNAIISTTHDNHYQHQYPGITITIRVDINKIFHCELRFCSALLFDYFQSMRTINMNITLIILNAQSEELFRCPNHNNDL